MMVAIQLALVIGLAILSTWKAIETREGGWTLAAAILLVGLCAVAIL